MQGQERALRHVEAAEAAQHVLRQQDGLHGDCLALFSGTWMQWKLYGTRCSSRTVYKETA